ncbi:hypothetical protein [Thiorhodococcus fuscus]|uniref:Uncharacterized protein n=1 Tax=Thiorhodococcus fuscus TaxID=527200 RepID=A0ABW4YC55_9GAMM
MLDLSFLDKGLLDGAGLNLCSIRYDRSMLLAVLSAVYPLLIAMRTSLLDVLRRLDFAFVMLGLLVVNAWFGWRASEAANMLARTDVACCAAIELR